MAASVAPLRLLCDELSLPGLLWAIEFDAQGHGRLLPADEEPPDPTRVTSGFVWFHFNLVDARVAGIVETGMLGPHHLVAAAFANDRHQRVEIEGDHVAGVVSNLAHKQDPNASSNMDGRLHFALSPRLVATGRFRLLEGPDRTRHAIYAGRILPGPFDLLEALMEPFIEEASKTSTRLGDSLDPIEDRLLDAQVGDDRRALVAIRRDAVRLHRQMLGLRAVFRRLDEHTQAEGAPRVHAAPVARLAQRIDSLDRDMVVAAERARIMQEEHAGLMFEQTNRQLHQLSVLTALFLPPALVTSFFSINPDLLPLSESVSVSVLAATIAALSALGAYLVLRRLGVGRRSE